MKELYPDVINLPNDDWQQGEMQAVTSIHMTQGFHASASDKLHLHTGTYINNLITEDWSEDDYKKNADKDARNTDAKHFESAKHPEITIYPNPTNGIFTINLTSNVSNLISDVCITDLSGKIIYLKNNTAGNKTQIDISKENPGIYILKIIIKNNILTHKIIKQ